MQLRGGVEGEAEAEGVPVALRARGRGEAAAGDEVHAEGGGVGEHLRGADAGDVEPHKIPPGGLDPLGVGEEVLEGRAQGLALVCEVDLQRGARANTYAKA